jgi:hypothetical protein
MYPLHRWRPSVCGPCAALKNIYFVNTSSNTKLQIIELTTTMVWDRGTNNEDFV